MTRQVSPRVLFAAVLTVSLIVLFAPGPAVPPSPHDTDKLVHAGLFLALGLTGCLASARRAVVVAALAGYAVLSEVIQAVAPIGRDGGVADALTDLVGLAIGTAVATVLTRRRR